MKKIGLFYASDGGSTQEVSEMIAKELDECEIFDVCKADKNKVLSFDNIIFAAPTYGSGDLQDDMDSFLSAFESSELSSKTIALVGLGDQDVYDDTFVNSLFKMYEKLKSAKIIGQTSTDGYTYSNSEAVIDGKFIGLAIDQVNQDDLTAKRIQDWIQQIKTQFS